MIYSIALPTLILKPGLLLLNTEWNWLNFSEYIPIDTQMSITLQVLIDAKFWAL